MDRSVLYELVRLVVHLVGYLNSKYVAGLWHPLGTTPRAHTLSSSRTHARMPSWNWRITEVIFYDTPKRSISIEGTVQRRVRSTESYALVRSIKYTYNGIRFFRADSCSRPTNHEHRIGERRVWSETTMLRLTHTTRLATAYVYIYYWVWSGPERLLRENTHTHTLMPPWEDQFEWHRMTRMTGPDCAVMCNLINTHTHTQLVSLTPPCDCFPFYLPNKSNTALHAYFTLV